jgi:uncharacterized membrane protein YvbJ
MSEDRKLKEVEKLQKAAAEINTEKKESKTKKIIRITILSVIVVFFIAIIAMAVISRRG